MDDDDDRVDDKTNRASLSNNLGTKIWLYCRPNSWWQVLYQIAFISIGIRLRPNKFHSKWLNFLERTKLALVCERQLVNSRRVLQSVTQPSVQILQMSSPNSPRFIVTNNINRIRHIMPCSARFTYSTCPEGRTVYPPPGRIQFSLWLHLVEITSTCRGGRRHHHQITIVGYRDNTKLSELRWINCQNSCLFYVSIPKSRL